MYNPGDPLLGDRGVTNVDFDGIYFFRIGNEGFVKRLQRIPGVGLRAISENKAYESWDIKEGMDFQVFARVVKVWKGEDF
jgi:phage repressor protein C with HTH and peptisase S24 domain